MTGCSGVVQIGADHARAPIALLERLHAALLHREPARLRERCDGVVRLVTCHRLELYLEGVGVQKALRLFGEWVGASPDTVLELAPQLSVRVGEDAARHLLRVAAGLESAVLGEDQIQSQVREAYRQACAARDAGPLLHRLFHAAFRAGKRVRSETALKQGGRSLAGSAVTLLGRELGSLVDKTVLVVGTGEMGRLAATRLRERGVGRLLVTNRTWARAQELAERLGGEALPWLWRSRALIEVDGVICGTGAPEPVIAASQLREAMATRERPLVVVDLAVPRNVEPSCRVAPGLLVVDVDGLTRRLARDAERREAAVVGANEIIERELGVWVAWVLARGREEVGRGARQSSFLAG